MALYTGLYGPRFAVQSSDEFARGIGYPRSPVDDLIVFHTVFGKTVPDISLNAIANLGYAECRFLAPVYPGDTLSAASEVIGLRENSNRASGVVYVRTTGRNQQGSTVLEYVRWVMVRKRDTGAAAPAPVVPKLAERVDPASLGKAVPKLDVAGYDFTLAGAPHRWGDYAAGEKIDHADAMTLEEAEHQTATRLYQNTAKVHFNLHEQAQGQFKRRLVYGGVVISLARALSFNGLANAFHIAAINGGRHVCALLRRRHRLRLVGGAGDCGDPRPRRYRRPARAPDCRQEPQLRGLSPAQCQGRLRRRRHPRPRSVGRAATVRTRWYTIHLTTSKILSRLLLHSRNCQRMLQRAKSRTSS